MLVQLLHADPLVIAISLIALLVFVVAPLGRWTLLGRRESVPAGLHPLAAGLES